jgi:hypothetical protein
LDRRGSGAGGGDVVAGEWAGVEGVGMGRCCVFGEWLPILHASV